MKGERLFLGGAALVIAAAVVWALWMTGGPGGQRAERLDNRRLADLRAIADALACPEADGPLPDQLTSESLAQRCPTRDLSHLVLVDPVDGAPYSYRREGTDGFAVCARFSDAAPLRQPPAPMYRASPAIRWNPANGCVERRDVSD